MSDLSAGVGVDVGLTIGLDVGLDVGPFPSCLGENVDAVSC